MSIDETKMVIDDDNNTDKDEVDHDIKKRSNGIRTVSNISIVMLLRVKIVMTITTIK